MLWCIYQSGDVIQDWRRLNVAFTRAKCKLIVVGSLKTLAALETMKEFCSLMRSSGVIVEGALL